MKTSTEYIGVTRETHLEDAYLYHYQSSLKNIRSLPRLYFNVSQLAKSEDFT